MPKKLIEIKDLKKYFPIQKGFLRKAIGNVRAVDGLTLTVYEGETLGLVGESGCGKTTAARCVLRAVEPTSGDVIFHRESGTVNITKLSPKELKAMRRDMQLIFQDPYSSLNPRMNVKDIIGEPLLVNGMAKGKELEDRVVDLMAKVGLRPEYMKRFPHAFSGGQRQRIGIARALSLNPRFIVCDEPVSALDMSIQAQILNLLQKLQREFNLTYLFIAHDLSVVKHISDRIAVMYVGKVVELAERNQLFTTPLHPYTEALLSAVPKPDPRRKSGKIVLRGEVADPSNPPSGCYYHPRCLYAKEICRTKAPTLEDASVNGQGAHMVACHFARELKLRGITGDESTNPVAG